MPIVPMRALLDHAAENGYGLAAFNVNNMEQIQAIMMAAKETDSPVIIQASRGARKYTNDAYLRHLMLAAAELYPAIPIAMHLDHGNAVDTCMSAIAQNFTSVMMDGSLKDVPDEAKPGKTKQVPTTFDENVAVTKQVVDLAHAKGITVEGELGCLGHLKTGTGEKEDGHGTSEKLTNKQLVTDPAEAEKFVALTGVDALAVAIGTSHGAYKFTEPPTGDVLRMDVIVEIHRRLPNCHLVMHGSSAVPQDLKAKINQYGGNLKPSWGVPVEEVKRGIQNGVRKVNVDTDNRLAITAAIREVFTVAPEKFDPRDYLGPAREGMKAICVDRMTAFGQAGNAGKIKPVTCKEMIAFYAK
ncbi:MAG TPA: class II fructose-bisphosphate aldolase [Planctomycetota bacterium]|nr:class II fructose-bisphosphate aldolase [Planctomycetota bacterium]